MKFLIVAGPYEADLFRKAVLAAECDAFVADAGEGLAGWIAAGRPDVIVLSTQAVSDPPRAIAERIRQISGGDVPLVFLCSQDELESAGTVGNLALLRPAMPDEVVRRALALVENRTKATGEFAAPDSATTRPASDPALRPLVNATAEDSATPTLQPLGGSRGRVSSRPPRTEAATVPWMEAWMPVLTASIDDTLDSEMAAALGTVLPSDGGAPMAAPIGESRFPKRDQETLEIPRALVDTILADARSVRAGAGGQGTDLSSAANLSWRRADGTDSIPAEGDLSDQPLPELMGAALGQSLTGRIRLRQGDVEKSIFFEAGRPVLAVSSAAGDRMVQMLVRQGTITPAQAEKAIGVATDSRRRMGAVLVDLGFLKSGELLPAVRQHYEEIIFSLFGWESGRYRLETGETADPRRVRLLQHPAALVLEGMGRSYSDERLGRALGPVDQILRLHMHPGANDILLEIGGNEPGLSRLPVLFDGIRTVAEVMRISAQPEAAVLQIALTLRAFGLLRRAAGTRVTDESPTPGPVLRDVAVDRERIRGRLRFVREGTYFEVLGVQLDAGPAEVRAAHDRIAKEISDNTIGPDLVRELGADVSELRAVLFEALTVLADADLGPSYRAQIAAQSPSPPVENNA